MAKNLKIITLITTVWVLRDWEKVTLCIMEAEAQKMETRLTEENLAEFIKKQEKNLLEIAEDNNNNRTLDISNAGQDYRNWGDKVNALESTTSYYEEISLEAVERNLRIIKGIEEKGKEHWCKDYMEHFSKTKEQIELWSKQESSSLDAQGIEEINREYRNILDRLKEQSVALFDRNLIENNFPNSLFMELLSAPENQFTKEDLIKGLTQAIFVNTARYRKLVI